MSCMEREDGRVISALQRLNILHRSIIWATTTQGIPESGETLDMEVQNVKSAAQNLQGLFNPQGYQNVLKTWAGVSERMTSIFVDAGTRSVDIMSAKTKEALSNLREVSQVRDEPAAYSQAYSDFARKQIDLLKSITQDVGEVTQKVGAETKELATNAGQELNDTITASVKDATDKIVSKAEGAVDKVAPTAEAAVYKPNPAVKKNA